MPLASCTCAIRIYRCSISCFHCSKLHASFRCLRYICNSVQRERTKNPFLRCPSVTPHLSSTCAHHVLVRRVREFVAETDVSRENQTGKIDRMAKELAALCLYIFLLPHTSFRFPRIADLLIGTLRSTNLP